MIDFSKKVYKDWKLYEIIFVATSMLIITICFLCGSDKNILSYIASMVGIVSIMLVAKGLVIAPWINIVYNILYGTVAITQAFYGEAIIYFGLMLPICIVSIISWLENRDGKNETQVKINKVDKKEYIYVGIVTLVSTIIFFFMLKALNTNMVFLSTISLITSLVASYLMFRRCKYFAIGFIANDLLLIALWSVAVAQSGIGYLPIALSFCVFLLNDIYAFVNWFMEEKRQSSNLVDVIYKKENIPSNVKPGMSFGVSTNTKMPSVNDKIDENDIVVTKDKQDYDESNWNTDEQQNNQNFDNLISDNKLIITSDTDELDNLIKEFERAVNEDDGEE